MRRKAQGLMSILFVLTLLTGASAAEAQEGSPILDAAQQALMEKTLQSGTLDIFDAESNQVRNLQRIKVSDQVTRQDDGHVVLADYRDINTGDIVEIEVIVVEDGADYQAEDIRIKGVKALEKDESLKDKEYTDEEIQAFMRNALEKQGQFTDGKIMLFDEDAAKMRNLELLELKDEVRRMGIFYNCRGQFRDADSGDLLGIDVSVENKDGVLMMQALRIRNVRKAPKE